jgi:hypothetical protein
LNCWPSLKVHEIERKSFWLIFNKHFCISSMTSLVPRVLLWQTQGLDVHVWWNSRKTSIHQTCSNESDLFCKRDWPKPGSHLFESDPVFPRAYRSLPPHNAEQLSTKYKVAKTTTGGWSASAWPLPLGWVQSTSTLCHKWLGGLATPRDPLQRCDLPYTPDHIFLL